METKNFQILKNIKKNLILRVLGRRFLEANGEILKPRKIRRKRRKIRRFWGFQKKIFLGLNRRFKNAVFYGVLKRRFGVFEKKKSPVPSFLFIIFSKFDLICHELSDSLTEHKIKSQTLTPETAVCV